MTISAGRNKLPQKIKYIVLIILTSLATLFFERIIEVIRTFNPYYDTEKVVKHAIDFIVNGKFRNSSDDIIFTTKVNGNIALLENMYYVEKRVEYEEFAQINYISSYSTDDESLHNAFLDLQARFKWDIWDEQKSFYTRLREAFRKKSLKKYKESTASILLKELSEDKSFYVICNNFYKEKNPDRNYYMIQIYMQNKDDFVYMSHFDWGELVGRYDEKDLINKFKVQFDNYFADKDALQKADIEPDSGSKK